jgi:hypothetical protein
VTTPAGAVADDANATARSAAPKQGAPKSGNILQKKYGPLPGWGWAVLAAGGALAFFWWRSRESKAAATTATTASTAISGSGWSGAANALQDEIDGLQGSGGATSVPTSTAKTTSPVTPGTGVTTSKTTSPVTAAKTAYPAPHDLHSTTYTTHASLAWIGTGSTEQHWQVLLGGKNVTDQHTTTEAAGAGHAQATGLKPGTTYQWRVAQDESSTHLASAWTSSSFTTKKS